VGGLGFLVNEHIFEALDVPGAHFAYGSCVQQVIREKGDLLHDIRQSNWELLAQEYVRFLFAGILTYKKRYGIKISVLIW